jgi:hypothetical protein
VLGFGPERVPVIAAVRALENDTTLLLAFLGDGPPKERTEGAADDSACRPGD